MARDLRRERKRLVSKDMCVSPVLCYGYVTDTLRYVK